MTSKLRLKIRGATDLASRLRVTGLVLTAALVVLPVGSRAQERGGLDPASLLEPLGESWPTYSGDTAVVATVDSPR